MGLSRSGRGGMDPGSACYVQSRQLALWEGTHGTRSVGALKRRVMSVGALLCLPVRLCQSLRSGQVHPSSTCLQWQVVKAECR